MILGISHVYLYDCDGYIFFKKTHKKRGEQIPDLDGRLEIGRLLTKSKLSHVLDWIVNFRDFDKWVIKWLTLIAKFNAVY